MKHIIRFAIAFLALTTFSCDNHNEMPGRDDTIPVEDLIPRKDIELTRSQAEFVKTGGNGFALDLFRELAGNEDMIFSPLSVTFALGMADNGATGNTKAEIEKTLGYDEESIDGLNSYCKTMMESAREIDPSTTIEFANAAVVNSSIARLQDGFKGAIETNYYAEVCNMAFGIDPVKDFINNWCDQKTHGMVTELLQEEPTIFEAAHLLNAVYFKGIWSNQFKKEDSRKEYFIGLDGQNKVNMMHQEDTFDYAYLPGICKALRLPFGNQAFNMVFFLPDEEGAEGFDKFKKNLDIDLWNNVLSKFRGMKVDVKIPSFETSYGAEDLSEHLQSLGIKEAFDTRAAFDLMAENVYDQTTLRLYISSVLHKAKIKVDEQGSEAAAVTDVVMVFASSGGGQFPDMAAEFHADRPFVYGITEVSTGAIFFLGQFTGK